MALYYIECKDTIIQRNLLMNVVDICFVSIQKNGTKVNYKHT